MYQGIDFVAQRLHTRRPVFRRFDVL
jgi:hypothetical protein